MNIWRGDGMEINNYAGNIIQGISATYVLQLIEVLLYKYLLYVVSCYVEV